MALLWKISQDAGLKTLIYRLSCRSLWLAKQRMERCYCCELGFRRWGRWEVGFWGRGDRLCDRSTGQSGLHNSGSSPASPTKEDSRKAVSFFASRSLPKQSKPLDFQEKRRSRGIFVPFLPIRFCSLHLLPIPVDLVGDRAADEVSLRKSSKEWHFSR